MPKPTILITSVVILMTLTACGGRKLQTIEVERPVDAALSCDHLNAEQMVNLAKIADLTDESDQNKLNNMGMLLASPLFFNLKDVEKVEIEALAERNLRLDQLKSEKNCPEA